MITTLEKIRAHDPCRHGWEKLLRYLGKTAADNEPLAIATILESNGLDDALWCLRAVEGRDREMRLYAAWCARRVQHLMADRRSTASAVAAREAAWAAEWAEEAAEWASEAAAAAVAAALAAVSAAANDAQSAELRRLCREIEAGRDPYPEENGR